MDGDVHWRTISRDNVLNVYGLDASSRVTDPGDARRVFSWLICHSYDDRGNAIVYDPNAFDYRFATRPLGGSAQLGLLRAGRESRIAVSLETAPEKARDELVIQSRSPFLGAKVANLSPALAEELHLDATIEGVAILEIADGALAANFGFQRGDVIVAVNNQPVARTRDLERLAGETNRSWRVTILRGGQQISAEFR